MAERIAGHSQAGPLWHRVALAAGAYLILVILRCMTSIHDLPEEVINGVLRQNTLIIVVMAALGVGSVVLSVAAIVRWRRVAPLLGFVLVAAALGLEARGVFLRVQFGRMQKSMQALRGVAGRLIHDRISRGLPLPSAPPTTELDGTVSRDGWGTPIVYVARGPKEGFLVAAGADRRAADVSLRSPESLTEFRLGDFAHDLVVKVSDKKNAELGLVAWPNGSELVHGCTLPSAFGCLAYWPE